MTARDLLGMIISGVAIGLCFLAMMMQPPADDAANDKVQRLAEAKMKARLFAKYPDPAIARMSAPVLTSKDSK
jgi:hypothetical protein